MAEDSSDMDKTEEPTSRRLEEAVKKGDVLFSREVSSFLLLFTFTVFLWLGVPALARKTYFTISKYITQFDQIISQGINYEEFAQEVIFASMGLIMVPLLIAVICIIFANVVQKGITISENVISFNISKISPIAGFKRIFSMRSFVEFLKGIAKIIIVGSAVYGCIKMYESQISNLYRSEFFSILQFILLIVLKIFIIISIISFFIALIDFLYQRYEYIKKLKMTTQEVKDEMKQVEGNPETKARLRRIRQERAHKMLAKTVPSANVVITNPYHYSVALKYDEENMHAPQVVAKGMDDIALKIREIATKHAVPIVRNPPLARTLFASCNIDDFIPANQYRAVAMVFSELAQFKK